METRRRLQYEEEMTDLIMPSSFTDSPPMMHSSLAGDGRCARAKSFSLSSCKTIFGSRSSMLVAYSGVFSAGAIVFDCIVAVFLH